MFPDQVYAQVTLRDAVPADLQAFVTALKDRRIVFLTGSGTSAAAPTELPTGPELAARLVEWLNEEGMQDAVDGVTALWDLGKVCEAVQARIGRDALLRRLLRLAQWADSPINLFHFSVAALYAEGLLDRSFTANWDNKIGEAAQIIDGLELSCPCDVPTLNVATPPSFVHVHGRVEHPDTLVVTETDLAGAEAIKWTEPQIRAALAHSDVVLAGFAVEAEYIVQSVEQIAEVVAHPPLGVISSKPYADFLADSPRLSAATGIDAERHRYIERDAADALGHALRSVYRSGVQEVLADAQTRASVVGGGKLPISGQALGQLEQLFLDRPIVSVLELIEISAARCEEPPVARLRSLQSVATDLGELLSTVLLLLSCTDVTRSRMGDGAFYLDLHDGTCLQLWPLLPLGHPYATDTLRRAASNAGGMTRPGDSHLPLVVVAARTYGVFPERGKVSLVANPTPGKIVSGGRLPADALTLDIIDARLQGLAAPITLTGLVELA